MIARVCDALRDLLLFVQLKNVKNKHGRVLLLGAGKRLKLLKVKLVHGCFSHFLNCTNSTKSRKTSLR